MFEAVRVDVILCSDALFAFLGAVGGNSFDVDSDSSESPCGDAGGAWIFFVRAKSVKHRVLLSMIFAFVPGDDAGCSLI